MCLDVSEDEILIFALHSLSSDGIPWLSKIHCNVYTAHFGISSLPPVVANRCSHVCDACCSFEITLVILLFFQSFDYCRASSTKPRMCLVQVICLSGLIISNPLHIWEINFIIGTLLNNQLVPDEPEPWPVPCIGKEVE